MGPQVLRSKSAGTEYHSAVLMTGVTWPSAIRPHTHTHTSHLQPPRSAGALDHCWCCPTLFCLGKISTINLQAVSHTDPPDPGRILQYKSNSPFLSVVKVCSVLSCFEHYPVKVDWVVYGKKGITNKQCESECGMKLSSKLKTTNCLLQGRTLQMNVDSVAADFKTDFPLYNERQKQLKLNELNHQQLPCYRLTEFKILFFQICTVQSVLEHNPHSTLWIKVTYSEEVHSCHYSYLMWDPIAVRPRHSIICCYRQVHVGDL